jgi:hypothetical protein
VIFVDAQGLSVVPVTGMFGMIRSVLLMLLLGGAAHAAPLTLSGSSYYRHLGQEYYLAALYLPEKTSSTDVIFSTDIPKRMRLVVSVNSWSPRMWGRDWADNFSINNSLLLASPTVKSALSQFVDFPREDLQRGDEVLIDFQPGGDTSVHLNGDLVLTEPGVELFNALLTIWVGKLPPSREFKQQILTGSHMLAMEAAGPHVGWGTIPERMHVYAGWLRAVELLRVAQEEKAAEQAIQEQVRLERIRLLQEHADKERERARLAQLAIAPVVVPVEKSVVRAKKVKSPAVVATEQFYYLQLLQRQTQQAVVGEINVPAGVDGFLLKSVVRCEFNVNRQHAIVRMSVPETGAPDVLVKEMLRAVHKAVSTVKIPVDLEGTLWPVVIEYDFSRNKYAQEVLPPPRLPESLSIND